MTADPWYGRDLGGYRVGDELGTALGGELYAAQQLARARPVILKIVDPTVAAATGFRGRFERDVALLGSFFHPHVVTLYGAGTVDGTSFLAMRPDDDPTLEELIAEAGALDTPRATAIVAQVATALDAVHQRGLVHRGLSPASILVRAADGGEQAALTDFAVADDTAGYGGLFQAPVGTAPPPIDYAAPEQVRGDPTTAASDVYALGAILFEALTGFAPFSDLPRGATLEAHLHEPVPRATALIFDLAPSFDDLFERALAKDPADRFASAGELVAAIPAAERAAPRRGAATAVSRRPGGTSAAAEAAPAARRDPAGAGGTRGAPAGAGVEPPAGAGGTHGAPAGAGGGTPTGPAGAAGTPAGPAGAPSGTPEAPAGKPASATPAATPGKPASASPATPDGASSAAPGAPDETPDSASSAAPGAPGAGPEGASPAAPGAPGAGPEGAASERPDTPHGSASAAPGASPGAPASGSSAPDEAPPGGSAAPAADPRPAFHFLEEDGYDARAGSANYGPEEPDTGAAGREDRDPDPAATEAFDAALADAVDIDDADLDDLDDEPHDATPQVEPEPEPVAPPDAELAALVAAATATAEPAAPERTRRGIRSPRKRRPPDIEPVDGIERKPPRRRRRRRPGGGLIAAGLLLLTAGVCVLIASGLFDDDGNGAKPNAATTAADAQRTEADALADLRGDTTTAPPASEPATPPPPPASKGATRPPPPPPPPPPASDGAGGDSTVANWPAGHRGYTAVVFTSPTDRATAREQARKASELGLASGVLRSDDFANLEPGVWVTFAGISETQAGAERTLNDIREAGLASAPYVRLIDPR